jgi:hypothetical protein
VIVILARQGDESARSLAARWSAHGALLLSPPDLSIPGWQYNPLAAEASAAVISRRAIGTSEITGVLTRLSWVFEHELIQVAPNDRAYAASEMNAFLLALLDGLACPLLNRPTTTCLSGPCWRKERWVHFAARLGIPVCPVRREARLSDALSPEEPQSPSKSVTVVGDRCFGETEKTIANCARQLASAAGVDLLRVHFRNVDGEPRLLGADLCPDISSTNVADAVLDYFCGNHSALKNRQRTSGDLTMI